MKNLRWAGGLALMLLLLSNPQAATLGAARAMAHWYASVAPALFPFLALMPLLTCREAVAVYERLLGRAMEKLFRLPGAAASAMVVGMVAGTPAGALAVRRIASESGMTRGQLTRVAIASGGFSPAFLVGGIGVGLLGSAELGWKLLEAQVMTQVTLAFALRGCWRHRDESVARETVEAQAQPVRDAVMGVLTICGYMTLFGALTGAVEGYIGRNPSAVLLCLLDVPSGARQVATLPISGMNRLLILAAMCGYGGACVIAQTLGALKGCGVDAKVYVALRGAAGAICAAYMRLLLVIPVSGAAQMVEAIRERPFAWAALLASLLAVPALYGFRKSVS